MGEIRPHFDLSLRLEGLLPFEELTCLDLGCGPYESIVARQVLTFPWKKLLSVDGSNGSILKAGLKETAATEFEVRVSDVRGFAYCTPFDVTLSFDVLEHLEKKEGLEWLKHLEKITRKRIVLFFPCEPEDFFRPVSAIEDKDNPLQEHLSHWRSHELIALGYRVEDIFEAHTEMKEDGTNITFGAVWAIKNLPSQ